MVILWVSYGYPMVKAEEYLGIGRYYKRIYVNKSAKKFAYMQKK